MQSKLKIKKNRQNYPFFFFVSRVGFTDSPKKIQDINTYLLVESFENPKHYRKRLTHGKTT